MSQFRFARVRRCGCRRRLSLGTGNSQWDLARGGRRLFVNFRVRRRRGCWLDIGMRCRHGNLGRTSGLFAANLGLRCRHGEDWRQRGWNGRSRRTRSRGWARLRPWCRIGRLPYPAEGLGLRTLANCNGHERHAVVRFRHCVAPRRQYVNGSQNRLRRHNDRNDEKRHGDVLSGR